jgi:hypothetical protein
MPKKVIQQSLHKWIRDHMHSLTTEQFLFCLFNRLLRQMPRTDRLLAVHRYLPAGNPAEFVSQCKTAFTLTSSVLPVTSSPTSAINAAIELLHYASDTRQYQLIININPQKNVLFLSLKLLLI